MVSGVKTSILIPSRNEPYLQKTIEDLLAKAEGDVEIIVSLDGYWPDPLPVDPRVIYIHHGKALGMRAGINSCADIAKGEFLMKLDAHCMLDQGYDVKLAKDCGDMMVVVPRRYALDPAKWQIEERKDDKYPIDYMYLDSTLHGVVWTEKNHDPKLKEKMLDETMSNQGSIWFMKKSYFKFLELMDESTYGMFWNEFQEIGLKCWLSGGQVMVNKNTWYAHWHKNEGRGYSLPSEEQVNAQKNVDRWLTERMWAKQIYDIPWLVNRFAPVPTWNGFEAKEVRETPKIQEEKETRSMPEGKWHQNLELNGVDLPCENPSRKLSKFWNVGKWDTFIKPLLPENPEDMTFVEIGCNVGVMLEQAKKYGFRNVVGVEMGKKECQMAEYYRDAKGLDYKILNRTVGKDFNFDEIPVADVVLMANVHFYIEYPELLEFLDKLIHKTRFFIIVSRRLRRQYHFLPPSDIKGIRTMLKDWTMIRDIISSQDMYKGDPNPREIWSMLFKSELERSSLDNHVKQHQMTSSLRDLAKRIAEGKPFDVKETEFCAMWHKKKDKEWTEERIIDWVNQKVKVMTDVKENGLRTPLLSRMDNNLIDGGHRISILRALGYKSVIIRKV